MDESMNLPYKVQEYVPPTARKVKEHISPHSRPAVAGRRANKMVTQRAIEAMTKYLDGSWQADQLPNDWECKGTSALLHSDGSLTISLFDNPILRLVKEKGIVCRVSIFDGGCFDYQGNPSHLTRERLNGLLDALSAMKYLPDNVKVIYDNDYEICYLARFEQKAALNGKYHKQIDVQCNPLKFVIEKVHQV